jgi:RNA polymerase sigma factor (sigma-70 family)
LSSEEEIDRTKLVDDHSDYLLSFAMSKLRDIDLAKDLVQDTFVSALMKLDTFEKRSKLRTWLTSILNRKIIDHWRKAGTRYTDPISSFFDQDENKGQWLMEKKGDSKIQNIEEKLTFDESMVELQECLDTLPEKWRGIVSSKYLEEKESEQICNDFDITPSNLWVIVHRTKLLLRDCLQSKMA